MDWNLYNEMITCSYNQWRNRGEIGMFNTTLGFFFTVLAESEETNEIIDLQLVVKKSSHKVLGSVARIYF